jgi:hypothetical protein
MEESKYYKRDKQPESLFRQVYGLFQYENTDKQSGKHLFTSDGRLVKNRSRVLTALLAKFTTCSHPASNIVFMMVLLIARIKRS